MTQDPGPIGVFDSGVGGLSVLRSLQQTLPNERLVYLADTAQAPYGEKSEHFVRQRSLAIAQYLISQHHIKALVVACNTATALAIQDLREVYTALPVVGVEPALKPALALSQTRHIGVMATRGTVASHKFARLLASVQGDGQVVVQACNGLALAIEHSTLPDVKQTAAAQIQQLLRTYTQAMGRFGSQTGEIDTLVLGCTHYVFVEDELRQLLGPEVQLVSTGAPVARQTQRLLAAAQLLHTGPSPHDGTRLLTTGALQGLQAAAQRWLDLPAKTCQAIPPELPTR